MAKWSGNGAAFIEKASFKFEDSALSDFEMKAENGMTDIIESSPIGININGTETGVYRNNWQIGRSVNSRVLRTANKNKGRSYVASKLKGKFSRTRNSSVFLFNNSPYAQVIEFGGYPDPVKKGTYIRGRGYVVRSAGGFSKQAPGGHFRIGVMNLKRNMAKLKGRAK